MSTVRKRIDAGLLGEIDVVLTFHLIPGFAGSLVESPEAPRVKVTCVTWNGVPVELPPSKVREFEVEIMDRVMEEVREMERRAFADSLYRIALERTYGQHAF